MSIAFWELLWKACLVISLVLFAGMAVVVTIGGAGDLRRLFERLRSGSDDDA